jgi:glycosyltransferase involved in cell wall biosynthesis
VERKYLITRKWVASEKVVQYANGVARDVIATRQYVGPTRRLLFVGQWIERKGIRTLAEAFGKVTEKSPDLELWCVGTRWDRERVLSDFPAHLRGAVKVIARVPSTEIKQYLDEAHIFVFPTLFEGFSVALIEAMGAGLPIITTDVAAASDLLRDGESALFVPLNRTDHLVAAIEKLAADQSLRERLGRQAQSISRDYEWDSVCARYAQLLISLTAT